MLQFPEYWSNLPCDSLAWVLHQSGILESSKVASLRSIKLVFTDEAYPPLLCILFKVGASGTHVPTKSALFGSAVVNGGLLSHTLQLSDINARSRTPVNIPSPCETRIV